MNKLKCADEPYMKHSFEQFQGAVNTYNKYRGIFKSKCQNLEASATNINLESVDTIDGSTPNISRISCTDFNDKLIAYGTKINDISFKYSSDINTNKDKFNDTKDAVVSDYNELTSKREKLDQDVLKVLGTNNSILYEKQGIVDSAIYTTLLWTVLATSVLYYTFSKL